MNILEAIIAEKRIEVELRKKQVPLENLRLSALYNRQGFSLVEFLQSDAHTGIIAEFKRKSPSKGIINDKANVVDVTRAYAANGASALSVLTDHSFFGGSTEDLIAARVNSLPILRKDFIIDEYQLEEARAMGADVILLIAACLSPDEVRKLAKAAQELGLEVLLELHDEEELGHVCEFTPVVGINNRNLKTFTVDIERSLAMASRLPEGTIKVAESGIDSVANIKIFREHGFRGFLIGEHFMKAPDPGKAFADFVADLNNVM